MVAAEQSKDLISMSMGLFSTTWCSKQHHIALANLLWLAMF